MEETIEALFHRTYLQLAPKVDPELLETTFKELKWSVLCAVALHEPPSGPPLTQLVPMDLKDLKELNASVAI